MDKRVKLIKTYIKKRFGDKGYTVLACLISFTHEDINRNTPNQIKEVLLSKYEECRISMEYKIDDEIEIIEKLR